MRINFRPTGGSFLFFLSLLAVVIFIGMLASQYSPPILIWAVVAVAVFTVAFVNTELALYILIFSMLLSPEFVAGGVKGGAALGRGVTLRLDDFLLVVVGFSWFLKNAVHKELGLVLKTPLNKPIFYYALACIVSTGFGVMAGSVDTKTGFFFVLKYFEYFVVYFMMVNHLGDKEQMKRFVFCIFLTCFIASIYGMIQIPAGGRVSAPFEGEIGEPNTFGGYLVFIGAVAAGLFARAEELRTKWILAVLLVSIIPPLLFTESRSSYLAFIPTCLFLGLISERRVIVVGLILISLALSPLFLPATVKNRILYTFTQREHPGQHVTVGKVRLDTSTSARLRSWKEGVQAWTKHPMLGYGVTGYGFIDAQFPRVLVESGVIGLTAFIYLLYSIFKLTILNLRELKTPYLKGLTIGFLAGFIGLLFHSIGANTFIIVRIMEPFWLVAGIITVLPMLENEELSSVELQKI